MAVAPLYDPCDDDFERLYRRYARRVYCYALAVLRNPADAEDVTQTTFLNAFRAMRAGTEPELPENWLLRIAHNTCRTRFLRAARRPREVPLDDSIRQLAVPEDEKPNLDEVLRALSRLPFNQRSALVLRELEGRSYEEIATTLGVTVSSVEALLFRARRSLRMRRNALRVLGVVQLPPSLEALFAGGAATTGGAVAGGGGLLKLATFIAAALTAGGAGYRAVQVYSANPRVAAGEAAPQRAFAAGVSAKAGKAAAGTIRTSGRLATLSGGSATALRLGRPHSVRPVGGAPAATLSSLPTSPGAAAPGTQPSAPAPSAPGTAPTTPTPTAPSAPQVPSAPAPLPEPTLPSAPQLPAPQLPAPQLPAPPAVSPPALPPPPALPSPPPLPPAPDLPKLP